MVTRQRRKAKARRSKTNVLPLSHGTNQLNDFQNNAISSINENFSLTSPLIRVYYCRKCIKRTKHRTEKNTRYTMWPSLADDECWTVVVGVREAPSTRPVFHETSCNTYRQLNSCCTHSTQLNVYLPITENIHTTVQHQMAGCQRGLSLSKLATHGNHAVDGNETSSNKRCQSLLTLTPFIIFYLHLHLHLSRSKNNNNTSIKWQICRYNGCFTCRLLFMLHDNLQGGPENWDHFHCSHL